MHTLSIAKQPSVMLTPLAIVVVPLFEMEKSVVVEFCVEEPIAKSVVRVEPLLAWIEESANGEVEATPTLPPLSKVRRSAPLTKKRR